MLPFLLRHQFDGVSSYYLSKPERALGGVRGNQATNSIRSTVVVHWARALIAGLDAEGRKP